MKLQLPIKPSELIYKSPCPNKDCLECFECLFEPILKVLTVSGMYCCFADQKKTTPEEEHINKYRAMYGKALGSLFWAYFMRSFLLLFTFIPGFYNHADLGWLTHRVMDERVTFSSFVIIACYFFRCMTVCNMFNAPQKPTKTRKSLAVLWEDVKSITPEHHQTEFDLNHMERALAYGVYPFMIFSSMVFTLPFAYYCFMEVCNDHGAFFATLSTSALLFVHFFSYVVWMASALCFTMVASGLAKRFTEVSKDLTKMYQDPEPGVSGDLDAAQLKHHKLCNVVQGADQMFQSFLFVSYVMFIPETCFGLFQLIYNPGHAAFKLYLGWWVSLGLATFLSLSLTAASVSTAAHRCQGPIRGLSVKDLTLDQHVKITMFLERLSGPTIGLSCLDLFVVTKGVVLSVASAVVTYFLIFVQFNAEDK